MYVIFLGMGHLLLCKSIKSDTICHYISVIAEEIQHKCKAFTHQHPLHTLSWFYPLHPHGSLNLAPKISACLNEIKWWEDMHDDWHKPLTVKMIHHQHSLCLPSTPFSPVNHALHDWFVTGIYTSFHLSKWAQEDHVWSHAQVKLTQESDPTAFQISDLEYFGKGRHHYTLTDALQCPYLIHQVDLWWCYQKNQTKNEKMTFICIHWSSHMGPSPTLCAVSAWLCIVQWWHDLCLHRIIPLQYSPPLASLMALLNSSTPHTSTLHLNTQKLWLTQKYAFFFIFNNFFT